MPPTDDPRLDECLVLTRGDAKELMRMFTDFQIESMYRRMYAKFREDEEGGLTFGMDGPTLSATHPKVYPFFAELQRELQRRAYAKRPVVAVVA